MQNKKFFKTIIFIVVLCIPLIYSFFYLKSYWDPYGNLTDLKVAIVNLDKGQDDTNQGNELVKELKDKDVLDLCVVDENQAKKARDDFNFEENFDTTYKKENPVEHAIMVKAAEADDDRLVG